MRLKNNARVQEDEEPSENPMELLAELDACLIRLEELIARINKTNNETKAGEKSITDLIARRDCLKERLGIMRSFLNESSEKITRYSKSEIIVHSSVSVPDLQKQADDYAKQLRKTDEQIQELNWTTELI